jgi:universal stress protein A
MTASITRILVPVDFSAHADCAVRYAATLAARFGARLELLHVVEDPIALGAWSSEVYVPNLTALRDGMIKDAKRRLVVYRAPLDERGIPVITTVGSGQAARAIVEYARGLACDLIVMGTHGRTGLAHLITGSVAERVVRTAPCPVLTVRDPTVDGGQAATRAAEAAA